METTEYKPTYEQLEAALNKALDGLAIIRQTASNTAHAQTLCEVYERHTNELIAPPPTYKEVTVERWECPDCGSVYMVSHGRAEDDPCAKSEPWGDCACSGGRLKEDKATKLTGTRRVPVKQPVRKRLKTWAEVLPHGGFSTWEGDDRRKAIFQDTEACGKRVTLTVEWEE